MRIKSKQNLNILASQDQIILSITFKISFTFPKVITSGSIAKNTDLWEWSTISEILVFICRSVQISKQRHRFIHQTKIYQILASSGIMQQVGINLRQLPGGKKSSFYRSVLGVHKTSV